MCVIFFSQVSLMAYVTGQWMLIISNVDSNTKISSFSGKTLLATVLYKP